MSGGNGGHGPSPRLFGTDGIRGVFGTPPLDEATVRAFGDVLGEATGAGSGPVVLGGDTRASTPTLCAWLAAGLRRHRVPVVYLGTVPTPCVAFAARQLGASAGIAVSASHNPWRDNGIKLIDGAGGKWAPADEHALEAALRDRLRAGANGDAGKAGDAVDAGDDSLPAADPAPVAAYLASLAASVPGDRPLAGLKLAIDAANGAAAPYAEALFAGLGAAVEIAHADPDGQDINRGCGSTHPEVVAAMVRRHGADLGIAFDGDADRAIFADAAGTVRDGDAVLYLWGRALDAEGALPARRLVATSMSNLGLEVALGRHGIGVTRCDVGDRAVVATMRRCGLILGGEQSGHIVHLGLASTGDGMLTAVQVAARMARAGRPLADLLDGFERYPQLIKNVPVASKPALDGLPAVVAAGEEIERRLAGDGRLVLRYSGTEPLARIMIEGRDRAAIEAMADELATVIADSVAGRP